MLYDLCCKPLTHQDATVRSPLTNVLVSLQALSIKESVNVFTITIKNHHTDSVSCFGYTNDVTDADC